jgi:hypothetical protein
VAGGIEKNSPAGKIIVWSQPEILLYDDDPLIRISYPDLVEENGHYYITETQKDVARVHQIDNALLEGLWDQFTNAEKTRDGLKAGWDLRDEQLPVEKESIHLGPFYSRDPLKADHGGKHDRGGFTIDMGFQLNHLGAGQTLLDTRNKLGQGLWIVTAPDSVLRIQLSDGRTSSVWNSDKNLIAPQRNHYFSIIVDGGPKLILFVIDGILNDGGKERQFGWGRFHPHLQDINNNVRWKIGKDFDGKINTCAVYNRALRVSEAISNYHYYRTN